MNQRTDSTALLDAVPVRRAEPARDLLRFLTCGSVDDGKSTLIGRLLFDSQLILEDQLAALKTDSRKYGTVGEEIDLALLVDGLEAEREQGITIDVAYRFFTTPRRSFIVADTPGHEQYTRNMATGASNSDVAVILVDARKGLLVQTKRHSFICSLLGIRHVVLAVNKIDLVDYAQDVFDTIVADYRAFAETLDFASIQAIPVSARFGENVTTASPRMPWYDGPALLPYLETIDAARHAETKPFRFAVQWVNRPSLDFRGFSGLVASGQVAVDDEITVALSGRKSRVTRIFTADGDLPVASAGQSVTLCLADEIDIARGDLLVKPQERPEVTDQFSAHLLWLSEEPLAPNRSYLMRIGTRWVPAQVSLIRYKIDINTQQELAARRLELNEIAVCNFTAGSAVAFDAYADNRETGAFVLVDRFTNETVGAGMIVASLRRATNVHREDLALSKADRAAAKQQKPAILWFTGLSGAGKTTIARALEKQLHQRGYHTYMLDGDNLRHGLNRDLGFGDADRAENIRRTGEVAKLFVDAGVIVLCSFISPFRSDRQMVRAMVEGGEFIEVFIDTPIEECRQRDPKGLYAKADAGEIRNFTGIDSPYEAPEAPELRLQTTGTTPADLADRVIFYLRDKGVIG